jgi:hypothetical protein
MVAPTSAGFRSALQRQRRSALESVVIYVIPRHGHGANHSASTVANVSAHAIIRWMPLPDADTSSRRLSAAKPLS